MLSLLDGGSISSHQYRIAIARTLRVLHTYGLATVPTRLCASRLAGAPHCHGWTWNSSRREDPRLSEVKAVLQRLQRISADPEADAGRSACGGARLTPPSRGLAVAWPWLQLCSLPPAPFVLRRPRPAARINWPAARDSRRRRRPSQLPGKHKLAVAPGGECFAHSRPRQQPPDASTTRAGSGHRAAERGPCPSRAQAVAGHCFGRCGGRGLGAGALL